MKPIIIDNFSRRNEFIQLLRERGARLGVEVGTDHGQYARQILGGVSDLSLVCIDPYLAYIEGNENHTQEEVDQIYSQACQTLYEFGKRAEIRRQTSMQALTNFKDNSLDFVFIDGNHSYKNVLEDITEWTKKVKPGGIVCGHDYKEDRINNYGVIEAVNEYVKNNYIAPLFILRKRGLVDCWMFIKS